MVRKTVKSRHILVIHIKLLTICIKWLTLNVVKKRFFESCNKALDAYQEQKNYSNDRIPTSEEIKEIIRISR